jgi:hypothetical protein
MLRKLTKPSYPSEHKQRVPNGSKSSMISPGNPIWNVCTIRPSMCSGVEDNHVAQCIAGGTWCKMWSSVRPSYMWNPSRFLTAQTGKVEFGPYHHNRGAEYSWLLGFKFKLSEIKNRRELCGMDDLRGGLSLLHMYPSRNLRLDAFVHPPTISHTGSRLKSHQRLCRAFARLRWGHGRIWVTQASLRQVGKGLSRPRWRSRRL